MSLTVGPVFYDLLIVLSVFQLNAWLEQEINNKSTLNNCNNESKWSDVSVVKTEDILDNVPMILYFATIDYS